VAELRRASRSSYIARSHPTTSSSQATRWAWPSTYPRTGPQTSKLEASRQEHHSARSRNQTTISPATPTWETSTGKCPRMDWAAKDIAAQSVDNRVATSVCWAAAKRIPSCRGASSGAPVRVIHSSKPLRLRRVSS
jgi:hypothetical protein